MTEDKKADNKTQPGAGTDALGKGIADLAQAALGVGVALSRTVADATTSGGKVQAPTADAGQIGEIVHYSVTIVRNLLGLVFTVVGSASETASKTGTAGANNKPATATAAGPAVHQGGTLRIPLSVENPGAEPMENLAFRCKDLKASKLGPGAPVDGKAFRFEPQTLSIGPLDFEKVTLFIDAGPQAAPGHYVAAIGIGGDAIELTVAFQVLAAAPKP